MGSLGRNAVGIWIGLAWFAMGGVLPARALDVPAVVNVTPPGGGAAAAQTIGVIGATTGAAGALPITGVFQLDPQYNWLDDWYDFRWINLVTAGPSPGGALPAIDPQIGQLPPPPAGADNEPYYWDSAAPPPPPGMPTGYEFALHHVERSSSTFSDARGGFPAGTVITFNTYLVVDDRTAGGFPNQEFCVLAGFSWQYNQNGTPPLFNPPTITMVAALPVPGTAVADITAALGNAGGAGGGGAFPSPAGAMPAGAAWKPITGCTLKGCESFKRCARWPRYDKAYTISSYKYTNWQKGFEWEVMQDPIEVPAGIGAPVIRYFDVPFSPSDLHLTYAWTNAIISTHHWKWNLTKGEAFYWRWYCLKLQFPFLDVFVCSPPATPDSLCLQEVDCIEQEPCPEPYILQPVDGVYGDLVGNGGADFPVVCGDNVVDPGEQCDDGNTFPGDGCDASCQLENPIPTVSEWGMISMTCLALAAGTIMFKGRHREPVT